MLAGDMNLWGPPVSSYFRGWRRAVTGRTLARSAGPTASSTTCWSPPRCRWSSARVGDVPAPTTGRWWSRWPWPDGSLKAPPGRGSVAYMTDVLAGFEQSTFTADGDDPGGLPDRVGPGGHRDQRDARHHPPGGRVRAQGGGGRPAPRCCPTSSGTTAGPPLPGYTVSSFTRACVAKEFTVLATGRTSPVIDWLRALAADEHQRCGGPGRGSGRDVLHRRVRPGHDGRRRGGGPGAQPALPAHPADQDPTRRPRPLRRGPGPGDRTGGGGDLRPRTPVHRGQGQPARAFRAPARPARATRSSVSSSTRRRATPTDTGRRPTRC